MYQKMYISITMALILALTVVMSALADDVVNNADTSIDATYEVVSLNTGDAPKQIDLYTVNRNGDGKNGCNLTGSTTLALYVSSSDPGVAEVTPAEITFTKCEAVNTEAVTAVTIYPKSAGSTNILFTLKSNDTGATFNLATANFSVTVAAPENTPPSVSVIGVTGGANYEIGNIPTASCSVYDTEDGAKNVLPDVAVVTGPLSTFGLGSQTVTCSYTDSGGLNTTASVTYAIIDTGNPVINLISRMPPANSYGWNNENVTVEWSCADAGSGVINSTVSTTVITEGSNQQVIGICEDHAGNTAPNTVNDINIDKTAPILTPVLDKTVDPTTNWFNLATGIPTISFTCNDTLSGLDGDCPSEYTFGQGANLSYSQTINDKAGNSTTSAVSGINVDTVKPYLGTSISPDRPSSGWWNKSSGAPTVSYTCSDETSGINGNCPSDHLFGEGENQTLSTSISDVAGNTALSEVSDIDVDLTNPALNWVGGPENGASYYFGFVPSSPTCTATDMLSGPKSCTVDGYGTGIGTHTLTATSKDMADNFYTETKTYNVLAWILYGFYQPVDMNGVYNVVKNGSTVPLKFEVFAGTTELTALSTIKSLTYAPTNCVTTAATDEIETTSTGGTQLRYDITASQFIYNWKTPSTPGKCYRVTLTTQDGSSLLAYFKLK